MKALALIIILSSCIASAEIIPASRSVTWDASHVGVQGGIPERPTIFADVTDAPYNAAADAVTDDRAAIQAAMDDCPDGQVVFIPAGTYVVSSRLNFNQNRITVRGAGMGQTIIEHTATGAIECFSVGRNGDGNRINYVYKKSGAAVSITAGATKESTQITVSDASNITVGNQISIDMRNEDTGILAVSNVGNQGYQNTGGRAGVDDADDRALGQNALVTAKNGNVIDFTPPLVWDYTGTPEAVPFASYNEDAGVEDMTINQNNGSPIKTITFHGVTNCWAKGVESAWVGGDHFGIDSSCRIEIRECYLHDGFQHTPGQHDNCLRIEGRSSGILVENNIFRRNHVSIFLIAGGGNYSVIAYNYFGSNWNNSDQLINFPDITHHGAHTMMYLVEGNVMGAFHQDGIWGTGSHGTVFRNVITGEGWVCPPYTQRGEEQQDSYQRQFRSPRAINLAGHGGSKFFNVVGNVIGSPTMGNQPHESPVRMQVADGLTNNREWDMGACFSLGYSSVSDKGSDPDNNSTPFDTLIDHGNYDAVTQTQTWDGSIPDQTLPDSLYLTEKPEWFGNMDWPPINPATPTEMVTNPTLPQNIYIPAQYRYLNGEAPTASTRSRTKSSARKILLTR